MTDKKDTDKQTSIAKDENLPIDQKMQDSILAKSRELNEYVRKYPILAIFFHREINKEIKKKNIDTLKAENKAWEQLQAAMLADLDKRLTKAYAERAVASDAEFQNFVNKVRVQREKDIARDAEDFGAQIEESYKKAETIAVNVLKEKEFDRLKKSVENFYEVQEEFNKKFVENMKFRPGDADLTL